MCHSYSRSTAIVHYVLLAAAAVAVAYATYRPVVTAYGPGSYAVAVFAGLVAAGIGAAAVTRYARGYFKRVYYWFVGYQFLVLAAAFTSFDRLYLVAFIAMCGTAAALIREARMRQLERSMAAHPAGSKVGA